METPYLSLLQRLFSVQNFMPLSIRPLRLLRIRLSRLSINLEAVSKPQIVFEGKLSFTKPRRRGREAVKSAVPTCRDEYFEPTCNPAPSGTIGH